MPGLDIAGWTRLGDLAMHQQGAIDPYGDLKAMLGGKYERWGAGWTRRLGPDIPAARLRKPAKPR